MSILIQNHIAAVSAVIKRRFPSANIDVDFSPAPGGDEHASSSSRYPTAEMAKNGLPVLITLSSTRLPLDALVNELIEAMVLAASDPGRQLEQTEIVIDEVKQEYQAELKRARDAAAKEAP